MALRPPEVTKTAIIAVLRSIHLVATPLTCYHQTAVGDGYRFAMWNLLCVVWWGEWCSDQAKLGVLSTCVLSDLSISRHCEMLYNLGVELLHCAQPQSAFDCLLETLQQYQVNPCLWLRLAECCIMTHRLVSCFIALDIIVFLSLCGF